MECREVRQLAEAFVSEQLLVETTQAVVAHLERCPACRAEIEGLRRLRAATRSAFERAAELSVHPEFATKLESRLRLEAARPPARLITRRGWLSLAASLAVAAAWGLREWSTSSVSALLHAVVGDHRYCALTFKLTEPPISLEDAARRYGEVYRAFETVEPSTTTLSGGPLRVLERHSCVFDERRFVHLVLGYKDEKISLLVSALPADGTSDATLSELPSTDGFHVVSFRGPRHAVFVVSSLNDKDMQEVARAMMEPVSRALASA
jgi:anti-sigma factor RsiW